MKQAIVLIHGVGEQVPMDTLRGFVETVWKTDASLRRSQAPNDAWSKPDDFSDDFELRRLTTAENREGKRTDFFEFYWAHMMEGTAISHVAAWAKVLLFRSPTRVPSQLRGLWWTLVILGLLLAVGWINHLIGSEPPWVASIWVIAHFLWIAIAGLFVRYAGDAARYLHVAPPNIDKRRRIREAGIRLIQELNDSKKYDRIVIVGHSLGTVIGYDILTHLWPRYHERHAVEKDSKASLALQSLEELARNPRGDATYANEYQVAQADFFQNLTEAENPWRITDFVTLGSPLAHAKLLLAREEAEFVRKQQEREFPTCPPTLEEIRSDKIVQKRFSFKKGALWLPHHAAVFAPTRWTNLYFPCKCTIFGDLIAGPLGPAFGLGIRDIAVNTTLNGGLCTHTLYWTMPPDSADSPVGHIQALRDAVRICEKNDFSSNP
jgi:hypothetical protein